MTVVGMIVRLPRTKRAGARGIDGFGVGVVEVAAAGAGVVSGVGEGVVDGCTAAGVTGFG